MGGLQNRDMAQRLARGGDELNRHLRDEFDRAAARVADATRLRILGASSSHPGTLRAEIAATVSEQTKTGTYGVQAEIRSSGSLMPEDSGPRMPGEGKKRNLPAYANAQGRWRTWRHPVFARSALFERADWTWVTQEWPSARGWFDDTIHGAAQSFSDAAEVAIEETSAFLTGNG